MRCRKIFGILIGLAARRQYRQPGNVSLDHKSIEELRVLFGNYVAKAGTAVVNLDSAEAGYLVPRAGAKVTFGIRSRAADITVDPDSIDQSELVDTLLPL